MRAGISFTRDGQEMNFGELLLKKLSGFGKNGESGNAGIKTSQNHVLRDAVQKFCLSF